MTSTPRRAWIRLPSGRHLDLIDPDHGAWTDRDLAIRLARTYRWGGESLWPLPLSVAQHSLCVLALRRRAGPLDAAAALRELLHDAEEAFLGFDCISPLKAVLGAPFRAVGDRLIAAIDRRYGLPPWTDADHALHKRADIVSAASEAVHCVGWSREEVGSVLGIAEAPLDEDPLSARYGSEPWAPWPPELAAERFLAELDRLVAAAAAGARDPG